VIATVFRDSQGVIYIDYLENGKTVTGLYYAELLGQLDAELQKNCSIWQRKKCSSTTTTHRLTPLSSPQQIGQIALRTAAPSTKFCSMRLFFVSKLEKVTYWAEI
jgi:Transposase.